MKAILISAAILALLALAGCGGDDDDDSSGDDADDTGDDDDDSDDDVGDDSGGDDDDDTGDDVTDDDSAGDDDLSDVALSIDFNDYHTGDLPEPWVVTASGISSADVEVGNPEDMGKVLVVHDAAGAGNKVAGYVPFDQISDAALTLSFDIIKGIPLAYEDLVGINLEYKVGKTVYNAAGCGFETLLAHPAQVLISCLDYPNDSRECSAFSTGVWKKITFKIQEGHESYSVWVDDAPTLCLNLGIEQMDPVVPLSRFSFATYDVALLGGQFSLDNIYGQFAPGK